MNRPRDGITGTGASSTGGILGADSFADTALDTCDVLENQGTSDGMGGFGDSWVVIGSYACSVTALTPSMEATEGDKITARGVYNFQLPNDAIVSPANRLSFNGDLYEVQDRDKRVSGQSTITVRARLIE